MQELKLHSQGQDDHLAALKEKYNVLKKSLSDTTHLTENQKQSELERIHEQYRRDKKDMNSKLF